MQSVPTAVPTEAHLVRETSLPGFPMTADGERTIFDYGRSTAEAGTVWAAQKANNR